MVNDSAEGWAKAKKLIWRLGDANRSDGGNNLPKNGRVYWKSCVAMGEMKPL